jgi:hypothetical protein
MCNRSVFGKVSLLVLAFLGACGSDADIADSIGSEQLTSAVEREKNADTPMPVAAGVDGSLIPSDFDG